jgi:transglutaminase-like putative cysteine protease
MTTAYSICHTTSFHYDSPVSETMMEVRMQPLSDDLQRCLRFELDVHPAARVFMYRDFLGNMVHHFDLPARHQRLTITARAHVHCGEAASVPDVVPMAAWDEINASAARGDAWQFRQPSRFAAWTPALLDFASTLEAVTPHEADPLTVVRTTMAAIHGGFEYAPASTRVDSPIDDALQSRRGVCQDFAHLLIALLRHRGLPARYVSGYVAPKDGHVGPDPSSLATHAWVEVLLPALGWVGVDPTHNVQAGIRHIRVAIGRDYADVPPTRGTYKGKAHSTLAVSVEVTRDDVFPEADAIPAREWRVEQAPPAQPLNDRQQQQQQQ